MGIFSRKSTTNQTTKNDQRTTNIVNDGDYAGVTGGVTHEENNFEYDYEDNSDHSIRLENDIDNSIRLENDIDNSIRLENDIDNSVRLENDIDNSVRNDIDNSFEQENDIDNSIRYDGDYAGAGTVNILDGGAIEQSFDFAGEVMREGTSLAKESINAVKDNASHVVDALVDSQDNAFRTYESVIDDSMTMVSNNTDKTMSLLETMSGEYASGLSDFVSEFSEGISDVQMDNQAKDKENLATIADLARSTSLQGQDIVASSSERMVMYFMGGVAILGLGFMFLTGRGS
ncbi:MAG: hypothetical protein MJK12_12410 [Colwellia sp.]|nr:hypothetical protein [Colwellia sp.]